METSTKDATPNTTTQEIDNAELYKFTKLLVGPIIGKVTRTSARILIEVAQPGEYTLELKPAQGEKISSTRIFFAEKADVFHFSALQPNTTYKVRIKGISHVKSSFTTLSKDKYPFNIAFVGGNNCDQNLNRKPENNLWGILAQKVKQGRINYLIHIGNNVYMDNDDPDSPYQVTKKLLEGKPKAEWGQHAS